MVEDMETVERGDSNCWALRIFSTLPCSLLKLPEVEQVGLLLPLEGTESCFERGPVTADYFDRMAGN